MTTENERIARLRDWLHKWEAEIPRALAGEPVDAAEAQVGCRACDCPRFRLYPTDRAIDRYVAAVAEGGAAATTEGDE